MKIAVMQPYFFPYLGYFDLIHNVDLFIIYDTVQYIRRGWIHRNRILHQNKTDWQYINVPIEKVPQKTPISEVIIQDVPSWRERLLGQLFHYKNRAPNASMVIEFVRNCLDNSEKYISQFNVHILESCSKLLNLSFQYRFCSDLDIEFSQDRNAEERILDICEFQGAMDYVNLPGGINLYHPEKFKRRNIKLSFRELPLFYYSTQPYVFEPHLSIIDLLMWNKPEKITNYLDKFKNRSF